MKVSKTGRLAALCACALHFVVTPSAAQEIYGSRAHPAGPSAAVAATSPAPAPNAVAVATLNEPFNDITTLAAGGWVLTNASVPVGSTGWFQGNPLGAGGPFDSFNGAPNAYIGANFNNTGSTGTISNWLMTPVIDFGNASTLTFYTRKPSPDTYPDRLEVRVSTNGASTNVGSGGATGDFTTLVFSINPNLVTGVYPTTWTQFTLTNANGLPRNGTGRIAFRYFVTGAGLSGSNSDYIGIDQVDFVAGAPAYQVGGSVNGLAGSGLTISLNGGAALPVGNGAFTFADFITSGQPYAVTVASQPQNPQQTCSVTNGSGTITANVTNVAITCITNTYTIGGTVSGLSGSGFSLGLNGGLPLSVTANGAYTFPAIPSGTSYSVTVASQPSLPAQTCVVSNATGTVGNADISNVDVACTTDPFTFQLLGGSMQSALYDEAFASLLSVRLHDGDGAPVPNATVTFTAPPAGPSATLADGVQAPGNVLSVLTDANGNAIVTATANDLSGCYNVLASNAGVVGAASFALLNVNPAPSVFSNSFEAIVAAGGMVGGPTFPCP